MSIAVHPDTFRNVRARMQRLSDAKFFSGWIMGFSEREVGARIGEDNQLQAGESFAITIHGGECMAVFTAKVINQVADEVALQVVGNVKYIPASEEVRYIVYNVNGSLTHDGAEYEFDVVDISKSGFGGFIQGNLTRGIEVPFFVLSPHGKISGLAEVRYCRPDAHNPIRNRIGLRIKELGRLEQARWQRMLGEE